MNEDIATLSIKLDHANNDKEWLERENDAEGKKASELVNNISLLDSVILIFCLIFMKEYLRCVCANKISRNKHQ